MKKLGLCQLFESDLVAYLGEFVNEQARIGAADRLSEYADLLNAQIDVVRAFGKMDT